MNAALRILTAAIVRARRSAPLQACTAAKAGTMNRPPAIARPHRSIAARSPRLDANTTAGPWRGRRNCAKSGKAEIERKRAQQNGTRECWTENDASTRDCRRQTGADTHRDREQGEIGGDSFLVPTD